MAEEMYGLYGAEQLVDCLDKLIERVLDDAVEEAVFALGKHVKAK
jgi:hypothetical protein